MDHFCCMMMLGRENKTKKNNVQHCKKRKDVKKYPVVQIANRVVVNM